MKFLVLSSMFVHIVYTDTDRLLLQILAILYNLIIDFLGFITVFLFVCAQ